jgi:hypothetical protein
MSKIEEVDVSKFFENVPTIVKIKKLTFGELVDIKDSVPMGIDKLTQVPKELEGQTSLMFIQAALVSAPFIKGTKATIDEVRNMDFDLGTFLIEKIYAKNNLSPN